MHRPNLRINIISTALIKIFYSPAVPSILGVGMTTVEGAQHSSIGGYHLEGAAGPGNRSSEAFRSLIKSLGELSCDGDGGWSLFTD